MTESENKGFEWLEGKEVFVGLPRAMTLNYNDKEVGHVLPFYLDGLLRYGFMIPPYIYRYDMMCPMTREAAMEQLMAQAKKVIKEDPDIWKIDG